MSQNRGAVQTSFKGNISAFNNDNQLAVSGYIYDGDGDPTTYDGKSFSYDPERRLTAVGSAMTAGYNGDGLRAWKQTISGTVYFLCDGETPICELNASGAVTATNTFGSSGLLSRRTGSSSIFYTFDPYGSVAQRLDSNGNILSNDLFDATGARTSSDENIDPFGYGAQYGYYTDTETGLVLLVNRYYDPSIGRFITRDPIGEAGGVNIYSYAANNFVNDRDPEGLSAIGKIITFCKRLIDNKYPRGGFYHDCAKCEGQAMQAGIAIKANCDDVNFLLEYYPEHANSLWCDTHESNKWLIDNHDPALAECAKTCLDAMKDVISDQLKDKAKEVGENDE